MELQDQLLDTWRIHARINLYLLDAIDPEALTGKAGAKGRSVGEVFAHLHNVRRLWLELTPEMVKDIAKIEKDQAADKKLLRRSLEASARAIEALLKRSLEAGKVKGFKPHPAAFIGYAIAHEAYHHGEIGIALAQSGHALDKKVAYGLWEWGVR